MSKRPTEAFIPTNLFETGIGNVIVARFKGSGEVEHSMFLVDAWCLGVKNVSYIRMLPENYRSAAEEIQMRGEHEPAPVACARKLVAGAVNYAGSLGFSPRRDFKKAWRVMGGVDPDECDCDYSFGENGKPHYFQGPHDTPAFTNRVITTLTRRLGEGNFHLTLVPSGIPFDFFDDF